jgi:hypothetical protein
MFELLLKLIARARERVRKLRNATGHGIYGTVPVNLDAERQKQVDVLLRAMADAVARNRGVRPDDVDCELRPDGAIVAKFHSRGAEELVCFVDQARPN